MTKRKPTADERDRAIVAEAGPWIAIERKGDNGYLVWYVESREEPGERDQRSAVAAARILNRIAREERARARKERR